MQPATSHARERMLEHDLAKVREFSAVLRTPLTRNERHPWLKSLSHLTGEVGEPHLIAIQGLSSIRLPAATFALIDVLEDPDFPYRDMAAAALRRSPHPAALQPLIVVLDDPDPSLRRMAARALGTVAALTVERDVEVDDAVHKLVQVLAIDPDPAVRVAAFHGLTKLATMEVLERAFDTALLDSHRLVRCAMMPVAAHIAMHGNPGRRTAQAGTIVWNDLDPNAPPEPMGVLARARHRDRYFSYIDQTSDCIDVSEASLELLAMIQNKRALPVLHRLASTPDAGLRATVVRGLAEYEDDKSFDLVVAALQDPTAGVRKAAIEGLAESENPRAGAALSDVLLNGPTHDQLLAAKALEDPNDDDTVGEAGGYITVRTSDELRGDRAESLAYRWGTEESRALVRAFADESARVRQASEWALRTKPDDAEETLIEALGHEHEHVRVRAARMLAGYRSETSLELLIDVLGSKASPQSEAAALALGLRGDRSARAALERAATVGDPDLAVAAIDALQDLGSGESIPMLRVVAASDQPEAVASAARYAIAMLEAPGGSRFEAGSD